MASNSCPICAKSYVHLSQHLRFTHKVKNIEERACLMKLANGKVNVRKLTCPVPGCSATGTRLDRHMDQHSEISRKARKKLLDGLKKKYLIDALSRLRKSNPSTAMASKLDITVPAERGNLVLM